jgi:hypothetical protein
MSAAHRFQIKRSSGWFAAGREVEAALTLLSDAAFKLFVWLCLHAERSCGSIRAGSAGLASALGKTEAEIRTHLEELFHNGVCVPRDCDVIEITDRFWPYERASDPAASDDPIVYIDRVKRCFLQRCCVRSVFTAADEKLAGQLYRDGVPVVEVERAILLGSLRKYVALVNNGRGTPITSLYYFVALFAEVRQEISVSYWHYVAQKVRTLEERFRQSPAFLTEMKMETK